MELPIIVISAADILKEIGDLPLLPNMVAVDYKPSGEPFPHLLGEVMWHGGIRRRDVTDWIKTLKEEGKIDPNRPVETISLREIVTAGQQRHAA